MDICCGNRFATLRMRCINWCGILNLFDGLHIYIFYQVQIMYSSRIRIWRFLTWMRPPLLAMHLTPPLKDPADDKCWCARASSRCIDLCEACCLLLFSLVREVRTVAYQRI